MFWYVWICKYFKKMCFSLEITSPKTSEMALTMADMKTQRPALRCITLEMYRLIAIWLQLDLMLIIFLITGVPYIRKANEFLKRFKQYMYGILGHGQVIKLSMTINVLGPVLHHYVVIFFWSSGIMECTCMLFTFENGVLLMR